MANFTEFNLPTNAYTGFDAQSLRDLIIDRINNDATINFTDQNFEGSNISALIDIIAYSYHTLLFYLNQTSSESNFNDGDLWSYVDFAATEGIIDPTVNQPQNLEDYCIEKNNQRNIDKYKKILTQKEWELLYLLNNGNNKGSIQNTLNISKQRFSFLIKSISQKVQQHDGYRLPN